MNGRDAETTADDIAAILGRKMAKKRQAQMLNQLVFTSEFANKDTVICIDG